MAEASRAYYSDDPRMARALQARLENEASEKMAQVAGGYAEDWGDYRERVGFIKGMARAIEIANMTEEQIKGNGTNARRTA